MNDVPRQMLRRIVAKYGKEICSDARRCENLLKDLCGSYVRETNVLVNAIEERVPLDLLAANRTTPLELLLSRLEKRLEEQTAMTGDAASWAVESWALALNLATESEIQTRRKRNEFDAPPIPKTETVQPRDATSQTPNINRTIPVQPPKPPVTVPPPPRTAPSNRQPPQTRKPAPPIVFPTNNQPANLPTAPMPTINQPAIARRSFGFFRGCLVIFLLLAAASVVLFLGVPFAIEKMRETQTERNNEPPRFPIR